MFRPEIGSAVCPRGSRGGYRSHSRFHSSQVAARSCTVWKDQERSPGGTGNCHAVWIGELLHLWSQDSRRPTSTMRRTVRSVVHPLAELIVRHVVPVLENVREVLYQPARVMNPCIQHGQIQTFKATDAALMAFATYSAACMHWYQRTWLYPTERSQRRPCWARAWSH